MIQFPSTIRPILHYPNPILKRKAKAVAKITPDIHRLIQDMLETMYDAPGVGLAAPQIGVSLRIVVIDVSEDHSSPMVFVNPKVTRLSKEKTSEQEGCLSIPGIVGEPVRSLSASMEGLDRNGKKRMREGEGLLARAFQHEVDHLNGTLFIDRVEDKSTIKEMER